MADLPARRVDEREPRTELARAAQAVGHAAQVRARGAKLLDQRLRHASESK